MMRFLPVPANGVLGFSLAAPHNLEELRLLRGVCTFYHLVLCFDPI